MDEPLYGYSAPMQEEILGKSEAATDENPEDGEVPWLPQLSLFCRNF